MRSPEGEAQPTRSLFILGNRISSLRSFCFGSTWSVGIAHPTFLNFSVYLPEFG
jgi:hypothetical protein